MINAEGGMGSYGEVCVTFNLEYDATLAGGKVYDEGLGFPQDVCASGKVTNYWRIDGVVTLRILPTIHRISIWSHSRH